MIDGKDYETARQNMAAQQAEWLRRTGNCPMVPHRPVSPRDWYGREPDAARATDVKYGRGAVPKMRAVDWWWWAFAFAMLVASFWMLASYVTRA